ncbi:integrase [Rummeliibacillus stabekisii]|uniref:Integrase n=1 Tax=Rummeliibacillus stabekisii TaxID=241244 RepID=A0A143HFN5_9BACL|nr:integrase [Rummeliibacillus stabekisii]AMX00260.1 integrase [Rummeliibacillus stabekisii]
MQAQYTSQHFQELIQSIMEVVNIGKELREDQSGINMSYNFIGDYVSFDPSRLLKANDELTHRVSIEEYVKAITIHELGHAMDRDALLASLTRTFEIFDLKESHTFDEFYTDKTLMSVLIEEHEMNIVFEETAWENAEKLNRLYQLVEEESFHLIKEHSLSTYRKLYQEDLEHFQKLQSVPSLQPA